MTLQDYLVRERFTFTAFASLIGTNYPSTVERYAKGQQIPGRSMMKEIVRVTNGEVTPNDFYGLHGVTRRELVAKASPDGAAENIGAAA